MWRNRHSWTLTQAVSSQIYCTVLIAGWHCGCTDLNRIGKRALKSSKWKLRESNKHATCLLARNLRENLRAGLSETSRPSTTLPPRGKIAYFLTRGRKHWGPQHHVRLPGHKAGHCRNSLASRCTAFNPSLKHGAWETGRSTLEFPDTKRPLGHNWQTDSSGECFDPTAAVVQLIASESQPCYP